MCNVKLCIHVKGIEHFTVITAIKDKLSTTP
jgi:hypothetical protein